MGWFGRRKDAVPPRRPDTSGAPDAPEPEHPGLVEELREELHQAVEHVPAPVRWTVGKLVKLSLLVLASLVIVATVSGILYLTNRTELAAHELALYLNSALARRSNVQVDIADVRGNPFRHVRLISPRVRFTDEPGAPPFVEAPWIDLSYEPMSLLPGREPRIRIVIESPVFHVERRADGTMRLPTWRGSDTKREAPGPGRDLDVRLQVTDASVRLPAPLQAIRGMRFDVTAKTGKGTLVTLRSLTWKEGPYHTKGLDLAGTLWSADSLHLDLRRARTAELSLTARGHWPKGGGEGRMELAIERLPWRWLAKVTGNDSFDADGMGRGTIHARLGDGLRGDFDVSADWNDLPFEARGGFSWAKKTLTFDPLVGTSPAGALVGDMRWSDAGWEVGGDTRHADPSRWGAIGIPGWPEGDLLGRFRYSVDTRKEPSNARLEAILGESSIQGWTLDGGEVAVRFPAQGPDSFTVDLQRRGGTFHLRGAAEDGGWTGAYRLSRFPLEEWPDGRTSGLRGIASEGSGTVESRDGRLAVDGTLEGSDLAWFGAEGRRWRLTHMQGALLPLPDLRIQVSADSLTYLGIAFDSVRAETRVGDGAARLDSVVAFASDTLVRLSGGMIWKDDGWRLSLSGAEARSTQFHWIAEPPVELSGDPRGVDFERLEADDAGAHLQIEGRWAAEGGRYDWRARATDLDLSRLGVPVEWGLAGNATGLLEVVGPYRDPQWTLTSTTDRPGWGGHRGDRLTLSLDGSPGQLTLTEGVFGVDGGTLRAQGRFDDTATPWPKTLSGEHVMEWLTGARRWEGEANATELPVDGLAQYTTAAAGWSGRVGGRVAVGGRPALPHFDVRLEGRPFAWRELTVEAIDVRARYAEERLEVSELRVTREGRASTARGELPVRLALGKKPETLDRAMRWRLDIPNGDLGWIGAMVPQIGTATGNFALQADVAGTPRVPHLSGTIRVQDGVMRMAGREETFTHLRAALRMSEDRITLDSLSATQGQTGTVRAQGEMTFDGFAPEHYRFTVTMRDCAALETGVYAVRLDGDLVVSDGPRVGNLWLPNIEGSLNVREAVILLDFANQSENEQLAATALPLYWVYRVQVTATHRVYWRPPDGDVEFSVNLTLQRTPQEMLAYGDMRVLRGTYYFLSNRFDVSRGELTFDQVEGFNPQISAEAVTQVVPLGAPSAGLEVSAGGSDAESVHRVTVSIRGRSAEPMIDFTSEPDDWDQARILRELTLGRITGTTGVSLGDPLDHYLTRAINRTLSSEMARVFSGYIDEWAIDRERGGLFGGEGELILGVGTRVTPSLQLRYRQRLPGLSRSAREIGLSTDPLERDLEAEYRLSRFFYVTSELVQRRQLSGSSGTSRPEFNVNLKARWEY